MKSKIATTLCVAMFATSLGISAAADVKFSMDRKKLGQTNTRAANASGRVNRSVEIKDIIYTIVVESTAFKDLENVTVQYNIYYEEAQPGSKEKPPVRTLAGKQTIEKLASYKKVEIDTAPITMKEVQLDGNYYFVSGASNTSRDRVVGSIIKAFNSEDKLLGEYSNPSGISSKFEWKKP